MPRNDCYCSGDPSMVVGRWCFLGLRRDSILARVVGFRSGRCRADCSRARSAGSRCGTVRQLRRISLTFFAKWKPTEAFTKKGACEKMQFFGRKMVRSKGLEPSRLLGTTTSRLRVYQFHHERIRFFSSGLWCFSKRPKNDLLTFANTFSRKISIPT